MSAPGQKDNFTPELRILVAALLSMAVILVWAKYFGPKPPVQSPQANRPAQTAPAVPGQPAASATKGSQAPAGTSPKVEPATPVSVPVLSDPQERTITVENSLYQVTFSNHGAVVKSWLLKNYTDDAKPPRILDLVHPEASQQTGGWPFALILEDEQLQSAANSGLYQVVSNATTLHAPADLEFRWSDGHLEITKHFHFDHSYVVRVETSAKLNGRPIQAGLAWLGGFGDLTVTNPAAVETVTTYYSEGGKITNYPHKKLDGFDKWGPGLWQGGKDFVGIEDHFFTAAFLPPNGSAPGTLETRYWKEWHNVPSAEPSGKETSEPSKETSEPVPEVAVASSAQPFALRVYVGPKDYDDLKKMNPPLNGLVSFGWLEIIAEPLFHALKWLHIYIPNWGWAIVVLTLLINMLLFPLRISGYKTTLKMQRVAPEIKAIQDRYKKYSMRDPRKADMQKEIMAVYSREGVNPVGGCVPQLIQFPIWIGLYRSLQGTIELRHAPWFGWVHDLSAKDPYYILPVAMGLFMYLASKMTPMAPTTDPQQQAMMKIMPIGMAALFVVIPYPSGLAVYILTSSVVGILQQWYLNRSHPLPAPANKPGRGKKS